jgi:RIO kinase 1
VGSKAEKKVLRREKSYERAQLMKEKRSEDYEVFEEVFDKPTLSTLYHLMRSGVIKRIGGVVSAGKESRIYWGSRNGQELALKIYLTTSSEFRKGMLPYIEGDVRFRDVKRTTKDLVQAWAQKEFRNLKQAFKSGVRVPKPLMVRSNVLVMEFVGKKGVPAPLLKDVTLRSPKRAYEELLQQVRKLYQKAGLVHGDLSQYNIMLWKGSPLIFDISQAVPLSHPRAMEFLERDIRNLNAYFRKIGVKVKPFEEVYEWVTKVD